MTRPGIVIDIESGPMLDEQAIYYSTFPGIDKIANLADRDLIVSLSELSGFIQTPTKSHSGRCYPRTTPPLAPCILDDLIKQDLIDNPDPQFLVYGAGTSNELIVPNVGPYPHQLDVTNSFDVNNFTDRIKMKEMTFDDVDTLILDKIHDDDAPQQVGYEVADDVKRYGNNKAHARKLHTRRTAKLAAASRKRNRRK